jgi:membrane associated rhomboid family serine protease
LIASAFVFWSIQSRTLENYVVGPEALREPWRLVTYAWAHSPLGDGLGILMFAFLCLWVYWIAPSIEGSMGSVRFAILWFVATILGGLALAIGAIVAGIGLHEAGPWLPISALTMIWAARNQSAQLRLYGLIPVSGKMLAVITVVMDIFMLGSRSPVIGVVATLPLGLWWLFGNDKIPFAQVSAERSSTRLTDRPVMRGAQVYDQKYYDDVKDREIEREEKERLRRLFEGPPK